MKGNLRLVLLGIFLACTLVQLVSGRPDFFDDSEEASESEEAGEQEDHAHHQHHQYVHSPFESGSQAKAAEPVGTAGVVPTAQQSEPQRAAPLSVGTNVSGFNETCNSTRICNSVKELSCLPSNSTCQCNKDFVYVAQTEGCVRIMGTQDTRSGITSMDCEYDVQCQYGKWGTHSRCELASRRCQCLNTAIFFDDTCILNRTVGDTCVSHKQCNATIEGEAICKEIKGSIGKTFICECADNYVWDNRFKECLKIPDSGKAYNSTCKSDFQCQHSTLGNQSRCFDQTLQCRCHNFGTNSEDDAIQYKNVCYQRKNINDTCTTHIECEASIVNAVCEEHPTIDAVKVCKCPSGKKCEPRNSAMGIFASEMSRSTLICVAVASVVLGRVSLGQTNFI